MEITRNILPISEPLITSYGLYTNKLSILAAHPETEGWLLSNFIQLQFGKNLVKFYDVIIKQSPWTEDFIIPKGFISSKFGENITEFLIDCINQDYYILLDVDNYFISNSSYFQKIPFTHELFVYGYDIQEKVFYISGNLMHGKYIYTTCTFQEMDSGYRHYDVLENHWLNGIILYKFKHTNIDFDVTRVKMLLSHYLNSTNFLEF